MRVSFANIHSRGYVPRWKEAEKDIYGRNGSGGKKDQDPADQDGLSRRS